MKVQLMFILLLPIIVGLSGCTDDGRPIGGQTDEHGCLVPAGYSWDADVQVCTRSWEIDTEDKKEAANLAVDYLGPSKGLTVVQVDVLKCPGCFIVYLQKDDKTSMVEITSWEVKGKYTPLNQETCEAAGNLWSDCGSTCSVMNQGKDDVACPALCEPLCYCAGIAGTTCPEGYDCITPPDVADAIGYCR
jgi:hypothetical protein